MSKYEITCYCDACNSPPYSRETASGIPATKGVTVAVHPKKYVKNKVIYIEGIGERKIQDTHGTRKDIIDVYVGECSKCRCSYHPYSGRICKVTGM